MQEIILCIYLYFYIEIIWAITTIYYDNIPLTSLTEDTVCYLTQEIRQASKQIPVQPNYQNVLNMLIKTMVNMPLMLHYMSTVSFNCTAKLQAATTMAKTAEPGRIAKHYEQSGSLGFHLKIICFITGGSHKQ